MKTLFQRLRAKLAGRRGQAAHQRIVSDVFATRDRLYVAADNMTNEIQSNAAAQQRLMARNGDLRRDRLRATQVADRLTEFFTPR